MPMKPHKGESQDAFMSRCMSETYGPDAPADRTQEQAVAICMNYWREAHGGAKAVTKQDAPSVDPEEDENDYLDRCLEEMTDDNPDMTETEIMTECQAAWDDYEENRSVKQQPGITQFKIHAGKVQGMEFILSDETVDRMGDVISASGWELTSFKKNPIALFNHNSNFPIGRWRDLKVEDGALRGHLDMAPEGTSDRIDEIRKLIDAGILRAVSVGFRPMERPQQRVGPKQEYLGDIYTKQELIETSLVSVPANPNALAVAKSLNISPATMDFVFAGSGKPDKVIHRRSMGGSATTHRKTGSGAMTLAQRIIDVQTAITERKIKLDEHIGQLNDSNVSDSDLQTTNDLNEEIGRLERQHSSLIETEKHLGDATAANGKSNGKSNGRALVPARPKSEPMVPTIGEKNLDLLDLLVRAGTTAYVAKTWGKDPREACLKIYGEDEPTKLMLEMVLRAASAPAMTTVTGWAAELVQQTYVAMMPILMPKAILTRLGARGLTLTFGRAGKINIPTRSRTPTIAGSFVGEGLPIPVRQGAFTSQALTPKKMAVITTWTREMDEHSIPAIEGILREAIQTDTTVAVDSVLIDANPATTIRPAGLLNGIAAQTATAGGSITAVVGDLKLLVGALNTGTYGNIRNPVWLMNPAELLSLSLVNAANTGIFPFKDEIARGTLNNVPIIDSGTVPAKTVILIDAADFVVVGGEAPRFEVSDQATLHMEDTTPLDLVSGSPGTAASPQRSLFQTDSLALRMILPLNWAQRRAGTIAWVNNVTW